MAQNLSLNLSDPGKNLFDNLINNEALRVAGSLCLAISILAGIFGNVVVIIHFQTQRLLKSLLVQPLVQELSLFGIIQSCFVDSVHLVTFVTGYHAGVHIQAICQLQMQMAFTYPASFIMMTGIAWIQYFQVTII